MIFSFVLGELAIQGSIFVDIYIHTPKRKGIKTNKSWLDFRNRWTRIYVHIGIGGMTIEWKELDLNMWAWGPFTKLSHLSNF